ncbi:hypothetical protein AB0E01_26795 [Nocardia vinacea]|uniref:hypothetical protein n=1 Tax=Nocardia vinacea TaxID=96468 RepID=UPI00340F68CF
MLAAPGTLPNDDADWAYEVVRWHPSQRVRHRQPEADLPQRQRHHRGMAGLSGLAPADPQYVIDGEIVVFVDGQPSFGALQPRMHQRNPRAIAALAASTPRPT